VKCIVFDLDGTLAESKQPIKPAMGSRLKRLLRKYQVAVISGGAWSQFESQLLERLSLSSEEAIKLSLFPTSATCYYAWHGEKWSPIYIESMSHDERRQVLNAFEQALVDTNFEQPAQVWGQQIEDRGSQITFSALGQEAPVNSKRRWDRDQSKRQVVVNCLVTLLPEFAIRIGGSTSIDVTKKGIDKRYGIEQIQHLLGIPISEMVFIGDALSPGGNDFPVRATGIATIEVEGPKDTLAFIDGVFLCK